MESPIPTFGATPFTSRSSQKQSRVYCEGCGGTEFDNGGDGFFYCRMCGSQSQDLVETAVADEDICGIGSVLGEGALYNLRNRCQAIGTQSQPTPARMPTREEILEGLAGGGEEGKKEKPYSFDEEKAMDPQDFGSGPEAEDREALVDAIRVRYVQGLQLMIQLQCEALVEKFGVSPMVCGVVGGVWLRFVAASRVFDSGWASKVVEESEVAARQQTGEEEPKCRRIRPGERGEPHNVYGQRAMYLWLRSLKKVIPLHSSLAISFLACYITRQSILPTDIVKWTLEAKLPYITAFVDIDKLLGKPSIAFPLRSRTLFRPVHVTGAWQLEAMAGFVAEQIGLHLPPVNFYGIACLYLRKLSLPVDKILPPACRIYEWSMPVELYLSSNRLRLPTRVYVMAILIVTIRILYNMHGQGVWEKSLSDSSCSPSNQKFDPTDQKNNQMSDDKLGRAGDAENYDSNKKSDVTKKVTETDLSNSSHAQSSEFNTTELLHNLETAYRRISGNKLDYSKEFSSYLKYCKDVIFSGISKSYEEEKLIERLWDIYEKFDGDIPPEQGGSTGSDDGNRKRSREKVDTEQDDNDKEKSCVEEHARRRMPSHVDSTEDAAVSRLKLDMEENGFQYLSPKVQQMSSEDYLQYRRKRSWGRFSYVAHADYYILLRSCARLAEVDCRIMHLGVLYLERRLAWTEKRIQSSLLSLHDGSVEAMINLDKQELDDLLA